MDAIQQRRLLEKTKEIVERGWTQGRSAETQFGKTCSPKSPFAHNWCLIGACELTFHECMLEKDDWREWVSLLRRILWDTDGPWSCANGKSLVEWNDAPERTKADILALLDAAIERAKAEEAT